MATVAAIICPTCRTTLTLEHNDTRDRVGALEVQVVSAAPEISNPIPDTAPAARTRWFRN
jgi:hypothetical protein